MSENWQGEWKPGAELPAAFVALPQQVYATDNAWLGESEASVLAAFSADNAWFQQGRAWLGVEAGAARLAGFCNDQQIDGQKAAFFGYWEGTNDPAAHQRLFNALVEWARQQGAQQLYGPINFTTFNAYRLRLDSFDQGTFLGEPWNPSYYPGLLEQLGFDLRYRYLSSFNATDEILRTIKDDYLRSRPKLEKVLDLKPMTAEFWMENLDELYAFVDQVFGGNFAYTAISKEAFKKYCGEPFATRFCPHTSVLAQAKDGRIAGFFLVYPDYSPLLVRGGAVADPASINYAQHYPLLTAPRLGLAKTGGVHPDYRSMGLFTAMGCELSLRAEGRFETLGGALVREDNPSRLFALRHGTASQRQYGLYSRAI